MINVSNIAWDYVEMQRDSSTFKHGLLFASVVEGTMWKCRGMAMPLPVGCSCYRRKCDSPNMHCKVIF